MKRDMNDEKSMGHLTDRIKTEIWIGFRGPVLVGDATRERKKAIKKAT